MPVAGLAEGNSVRLGKLTSCCLVCGAAGVLCGSAFAWQSTAALTPWGWLAAGSYFASAIFGIVGLVTRHRRDRQLLADFEEHLAALNPSIRPPGNIAVAARLLVDVAERRAAFAAEKSRELELQLKLADASRQRAETLVLTAEQQVSQLRNSFVSRVSHDLRTPLASIKAYIEMLIDGEAHDQRTRDEFYEIIQNEANRLGRLIDDLLGGSSLGNGATTVATATDSNQKKVLAKITADGSATPEKPLGIRFDESYSAELHQPNSGTG
jgi:signal transduction histidine kinase